MKFTKKKRKLIEEKVLKSFKLLDKTGLNEKTYKTFFKSLDDKQFTKWADSFFKDEEENFFLEVLPYKTEPKMADIKKAADYLKIPLNEYVYFNHLDGTRTAKPVPVG